MSAFAFCCQDEHAKFHLLRFVPQMSDLTSSTGVWLNAALAFIYPEVCQLCSSTRATPAEGYVCGECRGRIRYIEPPFCERCGMPQEGEITNQFVCSNCQDLDLHFSSARSAVASREPVLDIIHRYKYSRAYWFEPLLGDLLNERAVPELSNGTWDFIVPVPLHRMKEREREFNQAERLAKRLSRASGIPVNDRLVRRVVATRTQTMLSRAERASNVRRAFAMRPGQRLNGEKLVLVDDVFTTGATTNACARVLIEAGAGEVCVWTVARGV
jgi:ComF family protein